MDQQLSKETQVLQSRIVSFLRACELSQEAQARGKRVVFTSGSFDILHSAHLHYLTHLKLKGDMLIVGVDDNEGVRRLKGEEHPFFDEQDRAMIVANVRCVDYVFTFQGIWQVEHLLKLRPYYVGVPPFDPNTGNKIEKVRLAGAEVITTPPYLRAHSSSRTARLLKNDYLASNVILDQVGD